MDLQTYILNAVGMIGGFGGIGAILDGIVLNKASREALRNFLKQSATKTVNSSLFFDFLEVVNKSVFLRYFSSPFFSRRYFFTAAVISLVSVTLIFIAQFCFYPKAFLELDLNRAQIVVIATCVIVNIFIDWISIGQTQVFFEISQKTSSISRSLLLIVSDLVLTINLFALIYAFAIGGVVAYDDVQKANMYIEASLSTSKKEASSEDKEEAFLASELYELNYYITLKNDKSSDPQISLLSITSDSLELSMADIIKIIFSNENYRVTNHTYSLDKSDPLDQFLSQYLRDKPDNAESNNKSQETALNVVRGSKEWEDLRNNGYKTEVEKLDLLIPAFADHYNWQMAYTIAYKQVDDLQDSFPNSLYGDLITVSYKSIASSYFLYKYFHTSSAQEVKNIYSCNTQGSVWISSLNVIPADYPCKKRIAISVASAMTFISDVESSSSVLQSIQVPLSTFFMTSLLSTALLYLVSLFLFVATFMNRAALKTLSKAESYFMRAPLACSGLLIGALVFLLTTLF